MAIESFTFDKGINQRKTSLLLDEAELSECTGFRFDHEGMMETRLPKDQGEEIDTVATSLTDGLHRYGDNIYASSKAYCPGGLVLFNYMYHRDVSGSYSNIDTLSGNARPRFANYEDFTFVVDGESRKAYVDGNEYPWGLAAPISSPTVSDSGVAGNPSGTYNCYYTFYIKFPNDKFVESGLSPADSVTVVTNKISWAGILPCAYEGTGLEIHRRLWREIDGIVYFVAEIEDNTTTTYTDNIADATIQVAEINASEEYIEPPDNAVDVAVHLQRVFLIKEKSLYASEPYKPFSFVDGEDLVVTKDGEDLVGLVSWSDQLWMPSAMTWYRLQGSDSSTWSIKYTFSDVGVVNRNTIKKSVYGIFGLWNDGIYLFDGSVSKSITASRLGKEFFTDLDDLSVCYAEFDGTKYYFYYASSGTTVDSCIVLDCTYFPDIRIYSDNFVAEAHHTYRETKTQYWAKDGYEYADGGTETIETTFTTGDRAFGNILQRKCLDYFYYDIDTNNEDVTVDILVDGVSKQTITLNTNGRVRERSDKLKAMEGYRFGLQYTCPDSQNVIIYEPWALEATPVGV